MIAVVTASTMPIAMARKVSSRVQPTARTTRTSRKKNQTVSQWNFSLVTSACTNIAPRTMTTAALIQVPGLGTGLGRLSWTGASSVVASAAAVVSVLLVVLISTSPPGG